MMMNLLLIIGLSLKNRGDANMGNAAGDDHDADNVDDNEGGEFPKYRTAEGEMYYDVGDVPVGREVSVMILSRVW